MFISAFLLATTVMNAGASHEGDGAVHVCINRFTGQARFIMPGRAPNCAPTEILLDLGGSGDTGDLEARVAALEAQVPDCLSEVGEDAVFEDCNVQIVNGTGSTASTTGTGNLIVGYNADNGDTRTGSHNIIVGDNHTYSSYGGLVPGNDNTISNAYASVSGGSGDTASGPTSSVSGGQGNQASGNNTSVSGGNGNQAIGNNASVNGGNQNVASGASSSVNGGTNNTASGQYSTVGGGQDNAATGLSATVAGGLGQTAGAFGFAP